MIKRIPYCILSILLGMSLVGMALWLNAVETVQADSNVLCVNQSGSGCDAVAGGGCYDSVQDAVNAASPGNEIRIAAGTYTDPGGTVAIITRNLAIRGGYDQTCSDDDFDPGLHQTVLDAMWGGSVISITHGSEVSLQHLTLTRGDGTGNYFPTLGCGGGVYVQDSALFAEQTVITNNVASTFGGGLGGGVCARDSNLEIYNSHIISNTASVDTSATINSYGGGVYAVSSFDMHFAVVRDSQVLDNVGSVSRHGRGGGIHFVGIHHGEVLNNDISGNQSTLSFSSSGWGGGLNIESSSNIIVAGNQIENNITHANPAFAGYGGGVYVYDSDVHLTGNTILNNTIPPNNLQGVGIFIRSDQPITVSNNLIAENETGIYVVEYYAPQTSRAYLVNNTIVDNGYSGIGAQFYNVITMTNNLIAGHDVGINTYAPFTGTITVDTNLFWNTSDPITGSNAIVQEPLLRSDYHLLPNSPAVDAGLTIPWLAVDLEGTPRPQEDGYDIGAFEGVQFVDIFLPMLFVVTP